MPLAQPAPNEPRTGDSAGALVHTSRAWRPEGRRLFAAPLEPVRYVPAVEWDQSVVWITTRTIKRGAYDEFRKAWRPSDFPEGMVRAYECFSEERNEVVGISVWDSFESRERYRLSDVEAKRQRAMAPFVEAESSGLYVGRELEIPTA